MQVIKDTSIYLGASIVNKIIPFALLPFLTTYLTKNEFGLLATFLVINNLYSAFVGMALHTNITKNFFKKTNYELATIIGNVFIVLFISSAIYTVITAVLAIWFNKIFSIPISYLFIAPCFALLSMSKQLYLVVLRNEGKATRYAVFEVLNGVLAGGLTFILLVSLKQGWASQIWASLTSNFIFSLLGFAFLYKKNLVIFKLNFSKVKQILSLSIPLIPHALGGIVINLSDRLFIERLLGLEAVAIYAIAFSFGSIIIFIIDAFIKSWSPWFYKNIINQSYKNKLKVVKGTYLYLVAIFLMAYLISKLSEFVLPYMVDESYKEASKYIIWISYAYVLQGVYKIFFPYLVHLSKTKFLAFSTALAAIINLILNYILIPRYDVMGAIYATIIAYGISALLVFSYQKNYCWMPWKLEKKPKNHRHAEIT